MFNFLNKMKLIRLAMKQRIYISIGGLLTILGGIAYHNANDKTPILNDGQQNKVNDLSSLDRVKAIYTSPKIKKDLISDEKTQKLLADSGNPIKEYPAKPPEKIEEKSTKELSQNDNQPQNLNKQTPTSEMLNQSKEPVAASNLNMPCDEYEASLNRCKMPAAYAQKVAMVSDNISKNTKASLSDANVNPSNAKVIDVKYKEIQIPQENEPVPVTTKNNSNNNSNVIIQDDSPLGLLIATSSKVESLKGRNVSIGGASNQIKAGTTVLAVLNEAKTITSSGETYASASIIGAPFDRQKFPEGVTLLLKMKLNGTQDGIEGIISSCSSRRNSDKSISCAGQLEDISGASALRGEVYSSTGWQIVTTAATTFLAGLSLSKMTTSATTLGTTVDQTASNALYQALSGAITSMGQQISASFARSGTQISIPGRVVVRVLFTQDSVW